MTNYIPEKYAGHAGLTIDQTADILGYDLSDRKGKNAGRRMVFELRRAGTLGEIKIGTSRVLVRAKDINRLLEVGA